MRIQHRLEEHRGTAEVGQGTSISHPDHHHANIQTTWQAAAPLWPAWFDTLEAEEASVSMQDEVEQRRGTEKVGQEPSAVDPVQDDANIRTAWQAAVSLWPAWFDLLEAEERDAR